MTHSAAVIDSATGGVLGEITVPATAAGYAELVEFANHYPMMRAWAVEGTGGHGAGLTRHLLESSELVGAGCRVGPSEAVRATQRREVRSP